ncbi:uncharacterized protein OCT59_005011 [Rhizophagus irregularis]|uniref:uncharacterized protein n=1 Tax=Rhizophagus irregularis TaxID=588596 RepID=UPI003323D55C|nr:hypothetical protein OCT59_005011 [Rhizophagus irregularis]
MKSPSRSSVLVNDEHLAQFASRVIRESHAVRCLTDYGPLFGSYNRGSNDIMVTRDGKWSSVTNSYPNINIPRNFEIDDYEVFQVVKK